MHLVATPQTAGKQGKGESAEHLHQSAGELVVLSAADSDLALAARSRANLPHDFLRLRLATIDALQDKHTLEHWLEDVAAQARLVIVRLLGGVAYWSDGVAALSACCAKHEVQLVLLPGDEREDEELRALSTIGEAERAQILAYCNQGGVENWRNLLCFARALYMGEGEQDKIAPPKPILPAAPYLAGEGTGQDGQAVSLQEIQQQWRKDAPIAVVLFYRAFFLAADTEPIDALTAALQKQGFNVLPLFVQSLRDAASKRILDALAEEVQADVVVNTTGFALVRPGGERLEATPQENRQGGSGQEGRQGVGEGGQVSPRGFACRGVEIQAACAGITRTEWQESLAGLPPRELAMNIALPEVDGRLFGGVVSFKESANYDPAVEWQIVRRVADSERVNSLAKLARNWVRLKDLAVRQRRVAFVVANYPNRDGRLANGVGLDTPASLVQAFSALKKVGYDLGDWLPHKDTELMERLLAVPRAADPSPQKDEIRIGKQEYEVFFNSLPKPLQDSVLERWGLPADDPYHRSNGSFAISAFRLGQTIIAIQPSRGYHLDPAETYHDPALVPPHGYLAFYAWLRHNADVVVQFGKHGNLEWLPGKATALSPLCWPDALLGAMPHLYPFIVNDPGEGTQAKRRARAVILDHMTPPLARAESHGALLALEGLMDEYSEAQALDPKRALRLRDEILQSAARLGLDKDLGVKVASQETPEKILYKLDNHLCELKEMQIRAGLHVYGAVAEPEIQAELLAAFLRSPRGGEAEDKSLLDALAEDLKCGFVPTEQTEEGDLATPLEAGGEFPQVLQDALGDKSDTPWRTRGDTIERLEALILALVNHQQKAESSWRASTPILQFLEERLRPALLGSGQAETKALLAGLNGRFVAPGPSGAPSRGRPEVLPTGRNFYSLDPRTVPTASAWELGWRSAQALVERFYQDHGTWPKSLLLSAWGTANLRTGGDDLAQAFALLGVRPSWDSTSRRIIGFEVLPVALLGRPRVDLTLRVSGFFRDAFPAQIALLDSAIRAVAALDENEADNPLAANLRQEHKQGTSQAGARIFSSAPGTYGAGLQALVDSSTWSEEGDLGAAWFTWSAFAYGEGNYGSPAAKALETALERTEAVIHNQDNREHDLLDSDDYYQFEGGAAAAVHRATGVRPVSYHNDHSKPWAPRIRTLGEEIGRVVRGRATNPKWIEGMMQHGYKGAFEIAATVDYLFAFAATTDAVGDHHFDALYEAYLADEQVREFMGKANPAALAETAAKFLEAQERGLWRTRSNRATDLLRGLVALTTAEEQGKAEKQERVEAQGKVQAQGEGQERVEVREKVQAQGEGQERVEAQGKVQTQDAGQTRAQVRKKPQETKQEAEFYEVSK